MPPAHQSTRNGDEGHLRLREVDHVHQSTRNGDEAVLPTARRSHPCIHRPHFHLFQGAVHPICRQCTSSVRVHRHVTGAVPLIGCSAPALLAAVGVVGVFWAWVVFCLGHFVGSLWRLMLWFLRNVARNSPTCISNVEITSLEFCGFLDTYEKLGYPNYVRVLVDEAPKANSCVRSSSHDTAHDPRDSSPSRISRTALQDEPALLTTHPHSHHAQLHQPAIGRHIQSRKGSSPMSGPPSV